MDSDKPEIEAAPDSQWTPDPRLGDPAVPRTPAEVAALRADAVAYFEKNPMQNRVLVRVQKSGFTCDGCSVVKDCGLAFDGYNTDGDCLREK